MSDPEKIAAQPVAWRMRRGMRWSWLLTSSAAEASYYKSTGGEVEPLYTEAAILAPRIAEVEAMLAETKARITNGEWAERDITRLNLLREVLAILKPKAAP